MPWLTRTSVRGPTRQTTMVSPDGDYIASRRIETGTYYENDLLEAVRARKRRGVYVDVGSHCGNHTTFFAVECPASMVMAVEPDPLSFRCLCQTIQRNQLVPRVLPIPAAILDSYTTVGMQQPPGTEGNTAARRVSVGAGTTPAIPLDQLLLPLSHIAVIKIDVEGHSCSVLRSAARVLQRDRPLLSVECLTPDEYDGVTDLLVPEGYEDVGRYGRTPTHLWRPQ